jgi:hypothetical protein
MNLVINKYRIALRSFLIATLLVITASVTNAQAPDPWDDNNSSDAVPVDGGISLLVAAGIGYGAKKLRDNKRKQ